MSTANLSGTAGVVFGYQPPRLLAPRVSYRTYTGTTAAGAFTATQYLTDGQPGNTATNCHGSAPGTDDITTSFGAPVTLSLQALYDFTLNGPPSAYLASATLVANANTGGSPAGSVTDSYLVEYSTDGGTAYAQAASGGTFPLNGYAHVTASPAAAPGAPPGPYRPTHVRVTLGVTRPNVGSPPLGLNLTDFRLWLVAATASPLAATGGIAFGGTATLTATAAAAALPYAKVQSGAWP
jgi:hypothetical protein